MNLLRTALTATALSAVAVLASAEDFTRSLQVSGTPNVTVSTGSGYVKVVPGSNSEVRIVGHVRAGSGNWFGGGSADDRVRQIVADPPITQSGSNITIGQTRGNDLYRNIVIDYDINVPASTSLRTSSGSGNVMVGGVMGSVWANTGSGDVQVSNIGSDAKLETGSGSIRADGIHGSATLQTGSGDIELRQTAGGDVRAQTGSGSLRIRGFNGGLRAGTGSGDIDVDGIPSADWKLTTGSGSVRLTVGNAKFSLNASTGSGTVRVAQPIMMQGTLNRHHVLGAVNGGGPVIKADTGSGDIEIR